MRKSMCLAAIALLAGCGGGPDKAVEACSAELANRLTGKTFVLDKADMSAKAKTEADNVTVISSQVVFDAGLPSEYKQGYDCKVRIEGGNASVIKLDFSW
jgi:hypothetical protein